MRDIQFKVTISNEKNKRDDSTKALTNLLTCF